MHQAHELCAYSGAPGSRNLHTCARIDVVSVEGGHSWVGSLQDTNIVRRNQVDNGQSVSCNNVRMMRSLIRSGVVIGILSLLDVASDVEEGRLARRQLSPAARLVIQRLTLAMRKVG